MRYVTIWNICLPIAHYTLNTTLAYVLKIIQLPHDTTEQLL